MGNKIVKLEGKYLVWSGAWDAPITFGLTLNELTRFERRVYGRRGVEELQRRLERVEAKGTSSYEDASADDTIWLNRAGPGGKPLHREEIVEFFIRRAKEPTPETLAAFRKGLARCGKTCPAIKDADGYGEHCERCWGTGFVRPVKS